MRFVLKAVACCLLMCTLFASNALAEKVVVGYQLILNPWKTAIARGDFEKAGLEVEFKRFDSPGKLLPAMASGQVQLGLLGSTGVATAMSRGLGLELVWIMEDINNAEAMAVRDGSGISAPQDLKGKKFGVPFVSTTHFHTLFALEQFGIDAKDVDILNMPPNAIAAAWERGDIDAAFVWDPALSRILKTGKVLITSGQLGKWGKPTFDGLMANAEFAANNKDFMAKFLKVIADVDAEYRNNPGAWTPDSEQVKLMAGLVGGNPADAPKVLSLYGFPSIEEQVSCAWLGCGAEGGASKALKAAADFLKDQKKIPSALDDYSPFVNPAYAKAAGRIGN